MKKENPNIKNFVCVEKEPKIRPNSSNIDNPPSSPIFLIHSVEKGGRRHIEITFDTLIFQRRERPFDWYKNLELDKSIASKIRRGIIIPPRWLRIKIADYFKVDTSTIWYSQEMLITDEGEKNE